MAVDRVDHLALVDEHVVELDGAGRRPGRGRRHEDADGFRLVRVGDVVGAQAAVEEGAKHDLIVLPAGRQRHVLVDVVRAEPATRRVSLVVRQRAGRDRHKVLFVAGVEHPHELRPVLGVVLGGLVGDQHQAAIEQRNDRVHEAGVGWRVGPGRDLLRVGLVRDVEDVHAAIDVGEIATVRALRIDVAVVRAVALVERVARGRRGVVALLGARHVPAADFGRLRRVAHVDDAVELVIERVGALPVRRAGRHVDVLAVAEPELVDAAGVFARAVEERDRARLLRVGDVEQLHAGRLQVLLLGLVGDRHDVSARLERVRAHVAGRQVGLADHFRLARIGDVHGGEVLRRALMREPHYAAAVRRDLQRHAFAHAAETVEHVVREQLEVPVDDAVAALAGGLAGRLLRRGLRCRILFRRRGLLGCLLHRLLFCRRLLDLTRCLPRHDNPAPFQT